MMYDVQVQILLTDVQIIGIAENETWVKHAQPRASFIYHYNIVHFITNMKNEKLTAWNFQIEHYLQKIHKNNNIELA